MPKTRRMTAPAPEGRAANGGTAHQRGIALQVVRWALGGSLVVAGTGCSRQIEEEPPIPEHRYEPCESWCSMIFDPVCPQEAEVKTEEECFAMCIAEAGIWAPVDDDHDDCAATYIPYVDCLASLPCSELQQHFDLATVVPTEERSSCGGLLQAQLDCQTAHY
jgi:hypothetical protein